MKVILLFAICATVSVLISGCLDNPLGDLPDFIRLPFEGSGMPAQNICENQAEMTEWRTEKPITIEVEGACDGYATGARWITCYEDKVASMSSLLGAGQGPDGNAGTDSRPCLRYEIQPVFIDEFIAVVEECADNTGMWRVYFHKQTGLVDGESEFDCIEFWKSSSK